MYHRILKENGPGGPDAEVQRQLKQSHPCEQTYRSGEKPWFELCYLCSILMLGLLSVPE